MAGRRYDLDSRRVLVESSVKRGLEHDLGVSNHGYLIVVTPDDPCR